MKKAELTPTQHTPTSGAYSASISSVGKSIPQSDVEINTKYFMRDVGLDDTAERRTPHGARGLKCVLNVVDVHRLGVTPLAGRVD